MLHSRNVATMGSLQPFQENISVLDFYHVLDRNADCSLPGGIAARLLTHPRNGRSRRRLLTVGGSQAGPTLRAPTKSHFIWVQPRLRKPPPAFGHLPLQLQGKEATVLVFWFFKRQWQSVATVCCPASWH
jgi:hypothetical protein